VGCVLRVVLCLVLCWCLCCVVLFGRWWYSLGACCGSLFVCCIFLLCSSSRVCCSGGQVAWLRHPVYPTSSPLALEAVDVGLVAMETLATAAEADLRFRVLGAAEEAPDAGGKGKKGGKGGKGGGKGGKGGGKGGKGGKGAADAEEEAAPQLGVDADYPSASVATPVATPCLSFVRAVLAALHHPAVAVSRPGAGRAWRTMALRFVAGALSIRGALPRVVCDELRSVAPGAALPALQGAGAGAGAGEGEGEEEEGGEPLSQEDMEALLPHAFFPPPTTSTTSATTTTTSGEGEGEGEGGGKVEEATSAEGAEVDAEAAAARAADAARSEATYDALHQLLEPVLRLLRYTPGVASAYEVDGAVRVLREAVRVPYRPAQGQPLLQDMAAATTLSAAGLCHLATWLDPPPTPLTPEEEAAVRIQSVARARKARRRARRVKRRREAERRRQQQSAAMTDETRAALAIQSVSRGRKARAEVARLRASKKAKGKQAARQEEEQEGKGEGEQRLKRAAEESKGWSSGGGEGGESKGVDDAVEATPGVGSGGSAQEGEGKGEEEKGGEGGDVGEGQGVYGCDVAFEAPPSPPEPELPAVFTESRLKDEEQVAFQQSVEWLCTYLVQRGVSVRCGGSGWWVLVVCRVCVCACVRVRVCSACGMWHVACGKWQGLTPTRVLVDCCFTPAAWRVLGCQDPAQA